MDAEKKDMKIKKINVCLFLYVDDVAVECDFDGSECGLNQEQMGDQDDWRVVSMSEAIYGINDHSTRTRKIK